MGIYLLYHRPSMWATNKILTELDDTLTVAVEEYTTKCVANNKKLVSPWCTVPDRHKLAHHTYREHIQ